MSLKFEVTEQAGQSVLSVRKRLNAAKLPQELGKAYGAIMGYLGELRASPSGPAFAAYYNMDMEDLDVEMGFLVSSPVAGKGDVALSSIPAGRQASTMHKGPYEDMKPVYEGLTAWISENGYTPTGVVYEFYYNSPMEVSESELLTKIVFLLK